MNRYAVINKRSVGQRRRQRGLSLIETICTMTIVGGISATAAPMVAELPSQARVSVVEHMAGALHSASDLVHMKCIVSAGCGAGDGSDQVSVEGGQVTLHLGYPQGGSTEGIESAVAFSGFTPVRDGRATLFQKNGARNMPTCAARYEAPTVVGAMPVITAVTTGC